MSTDEANSERLYSYRRNLGTYFGRVAVQAVPGIIIGLALDQAMAKLQQRYSWRPLTVIIIQVIIIILLLYIIEMKISRFYASEWQNNTPGLFFVAFFFGTQANLITNIIALLKK